MQVSYPHLYEEFNGFEYLFRRGGAKLWSELEDSLDINWDEFCPDVLSKTYPNMADDGPSWDDFWVEPRLRFEFLKLFTCDKFREWVDSIDDSCAKICLSLAGIAVFVTFNYMPTLEYVYGVDGDKILHIHGSIHR